MDKSGSEEADRLAELRARDFWTALVLIGVSLFFLWKTLDIPMGGKNGAGVSGAGWYISAAVIPLGIFVALLLLALVLLAVSVRSGGAARALSAAGLGWSPSEAWRVTAIALMLLAYIVGLVPRVDFVLASALLITALIGGFHGQAKPRPLVPLLTMALAATYATMAHFPQAEWGAWDDDWVTLALLVALTIWHQRTARLRITPALAFGVPLVLVCAMAFGFRQNVPNRGGLVFSQLEYAYYVHLRPLWRS